MGRCDPKLRGVGNTCHVYASIHVYSMRMVMHEFMIHELCMCIEMCACEFMHVGELRNGNSHVIIVEWNCCSTLVFDTTSCIDLWCYMVLECLEFD